MTATIRDRWRTTSGIATFNQQRDTPRWPRIGSRDFGRTERIRGVSGCLYRKLDSAIMVMKSAEDGHRYDAACVLDGAMDRSILLERRIASEALNGKALASCYLRRLTLALSARRLNWLCSTIPSLTLRRPRREAMHQSPSWRTQSRPPSRA